MSDPLDKLAWTSEVPTEEGVYLLDLLNRVRVVGLDANGVAWDYESGFDFSPAASSGRWCRVSEQGEAKQQAEGPRLPGPGDPDFGSRLHGLQEDIDAQRGALDTQTLDWIDRVTRG